MMVAQCRRPYAQLSSLQGTRYPLSAGAIAEADPCPVDMHAVDADSQALCIDLAYRRLVASAMDMGIQEVGKSQHEEKFPVANHLASEVASSAMELASLVEPYLGFAAVCHDDGADVGCLTRFVRLQNQMP